MTEYTTSEFLKDDPQSVEVGNVLSRTFELIKEHPAELIGLTFCGLLLSVVINIGMAFAEGLGTQVVLSIASGMGGDTAQSAAMAAVVAASLVKTGLLTAVSSVLSAAFIIMWLRLIRNQQFSVDLLFEAKRFIIPMFLIQFATQFAVFAGFMACIIPGFIVAIGLCLSSIVAVDHGLKPLDAMSASWEISNGRKLDIFVLLLLLSLLNFAGALACGMGLLITIPMSAGTLCSFYNSITVPGNNYFAAGEGNNTPQNNNPGGW